MQLEVVLVGAGTDPPFVHWLEPDVKAKSPAFAPEIAKPFVDAIVNA